MDDQFLFMDKIVRSAAANLRALWKRIIDPRAAHPDKGEGLAGRMIQKVQPLIPPRGDWKGWILFVSAVLLSLLLVISYVVFFLVPAADLTPAQEYDREEQIPADIMKTVFWIGLTIWLWQKLIRHLRAQKRSEDLTRQPLSGDSTPPSPKSITPDVRPLTTTSRPLPPNESVSELPSPTTPDPQPIATISPAQPPADLVSHRQKSFVRHQATLWIALFSLIYGIVFTIHYGPQLSDNESLAAAFGVSAALFAISLVPAGLIEYVSILRNRRSRFSYGTWAVSACVLAVIMALLPANRQTEQVSTDATSPSPSRATESSQEDPFTSLLSRAEKGDAQAQYYLGLSYRDGRDGVGFPRDRTLREVMGRQWIRTAADAGNLRAQTYLANGYFFGSDGFPKDPLEGLKWFRMAAEQGDEFSQFWLGMEYLSGLHVPKNRTEAVKWLSQAAHHGFISAASELSRMYRDGKWGTRKDDAEGSKWTLMAAEFGSAFHQTEIGKDITNGSHGRRQDRAKAFEWFMRAARQGYGHGQDLVGFSYTVGLGVPRNYVEAYAWMSLAQAQDHSLGDEFDRLERRMSREEVAEAQRRARAFIPTPEVPSGGNDAPAPSAQEAVGSGSGVIITADGFVATSHHVTNAGTRFMVLTETGSHEATLVKSDVSNDLSILKMSGQFSPLPISPSRSVRLGAMVGTVGFPNPSLQGFSPKLSKGEIASLAGPQDDPRYFQISAPIQPGNSGGALFDEYGNIIGVVAAKLNEEAARTSSGQRPENVNYAIKSVYLLGLVESLPEVSAKLPAPWTGGRSFEDVVNTAQRATVMILVY